MPGLLRKIGEPPIGAPPGGGQPAPDREGTPRMASRVRGTDTRPSARMTIPFAPSASGRRPVSTGRRGWFRGNRGRESWRDGQASSAGVLAVRRLRRRVDRVYTSRPVPEKAQLASRASGTNYNVIVEITIPALTAPVAQLRGEVVADVVDETVAAVIEAGHDVTLAVGERPGHHLGVLDADDGVGGADEEARPPARPDAVDVAHRVGGAEVRVVAAQCVEDDRELRRRRQPGGVEQRRHPPQKAHRGGRK